MLGQYSNLLGNREAGPIPPDRQDYDTHDEYVLAFFIWRSIQRDSRLTDDERDVSLGVYETEARKRDSK